jgi:hypothetical protein
MKLSPRAVDNPTAIVKGFAAWYGGSIPSGGLVFHLISGLSPGFSQG